jgi:hypothetical protein
MLLLINRESPTGILLVKYAKNSATHSIRKGFIYANVPEW